MTTADVTTKLAERITFFFSDANFSKDEVCIECVKVFVWAPFGFLLVDGREVGMWLLLIIFHYPQSFDYIWRYFAPPML